MHNTWSISDEKHLHGPCAENYSPALLSEMMRKKSRPVQCLGHGDYCLILVIGKGAVLWDAGVNEI